MQRILSVLGGVLAIGFSALAQTPTITAVQDAASNTANVAQGSIFVVKGSNLSGPGLVQGAPPLVTTLPGTGVKITFTPVAGGTGTDAYMFYTYNQGDVNQLAGLLPSTVAPGDYNVRVTYNGAVSAAFRSTVVARKFRLLTSDGSGSGLAVLQGYVSQTQLDVNRFTTFATGGFTFAPVHPGQVVIAWGTGLGAITKPDNEAPGAVDFKSADVKVLIGDQTVITLAPGDATTYAGRAPTLPGTDQLVFTIPQNVETGCTVNFQISVAGQLSNATTIAIAPGSASACVSPYVDQSTLSRLDQGGSLISGSFALSQLSSTMSFSGQTVGVKIENAGGAFTKYTGAQIASATMTLNPTGSCQVFHRVGDQNTLITGGSTVALDAGALTLSGPNITTPKAFTKTANAYSLDLGMSISGLPISVPGFNANPVISQGQYTITGTGATGGTSAIPTVGAFTARVTVGPTLTLSAALPDSVTRSNPLTLNWTGGNATDVVEIIGFSGVPVGASTTVYDADVFLCLTTADKRTFTVPSSVLSQVMATPASGAGALMFLSSTRPTSGNGMFSAPLVPSGTTDLGVFLGTVGYISSASYK